jgi:hypothetical protein
MVQTPPRQFFSYPAAVTITSDRAAKLDQCLALVAFTSDGSFSCHTYCDTGPRFIRSPMADPGISERGRGGAVEDRGSALKPPVGSG